MEPNPNPEHIPRSLSGFTLFLFRKIVTQKRWLLLPAWLLLAAVVLAIIVGGASTLLPAIYVAM